MKTLLSSILLLFVVTIFAQQNGNFVYLFGSTELKIIEFNRGSFKEYTLKSDSAVELVSSFTLYNDEIPKFNERFVSEYQKLYKQDTIKILKKNVSELMMEANNVYQRLRNNEAINKLAKIADIQPLAGLLIIDDKIPIQQVSRDIHRQITTQVNSKLEQINNGDTVEIQVMCSEKLEQANNVNTAETKVIDYEKLVEDALSTDGYIKFFEVQTNKADASDVKYKYLEVSNGKILNRYKSKKKLKKRMYKTIIDSIQNMKKQELDSLISLYNDIIFYKQWHNEEMYFYNEELKRTIDSLSYFKKINTRNENSVSNLSKADTVILKKNEYNDTVLIKKIRNLSTNVLNISSFIKDEKKTLNKLINHEESICEKYYNAVRNRIKQELNVDSIQIEFNEGSIENLQVIGSLNVNTEVCMNEEAPVSIKFSNDFPFGFTSKREIKLLNKRWIFSDGNDGYFYKINVGTLFKEYLEKYEVQRRDYSPKNIVVELKRNDPQTYNSEEKKFYKKLYKEFSSEILTGTIFTDLVGLAGNEPNGIIQTEFYKDLAINKNRYLWFGKNYRTVDGYNLCERKTSITINSGFIAYVRPHGVISKIEANNRYLDLIPKLEVTENDLVDTVFYASTLDLRKHEGFRVGLNINIGLLDVPEWKSTFYLEYSFYWGRVPVRKTYGVTSLPEEFSSNLIEHGPSLAWELFTDERYGLRLTWGYNWYNSKDDRFIQVDDINSLYDDSRNNHNYWVANFLAYIKPDRDGRGKLFFRYRFFITSSNWDLNWSQVQVGYAFTLNKTTAPKIPEE